MKKLSKYTTELRYILESNFDLGMNEYEIISEEYRVKLNKKILEHFYFHEIGFETVARFKHYLNSTLNEIMPKYNKIIQSELLEVNPLLSFERRTTSNATEGVNNNTIRTSEISGKQTLNSSTGSTDTSQNDESETFYDTPSGSLGDIESSNYATNLTSRNNSGGNSSETTGESTNTNSDEVNENITGTSEVLKENVIVENGFEIPLADLLEKYRNSLINVDLLVIHDLKDLFMQIY